MLAALYLLTAAVVPDDQMVVWLLVGADLVALLSVPSVLLRRRGRPLAALSWLLAVAAMPYVGVILWWTVGRSHLDRLRLRRARQPTHQARATTGTLSSMPFYTEEYRGSDGIFAPTAGNQLELLVKSEFFDALRAAIAAAREEIDVLFYIWKDDATGTDIRDLLIERARAGVKVRVLVDDMGSPAMRGRFARPLREAGAEVMRFLPVRFRPWNPTLNFRNHRKLVVVDHKVALTGGANLGVEYEHDWFDLGVRVRGPAVSDLHEVFVEDWMFALAEAKRDCTACTVMEEPAAPIPGADGVIAIVASGPDRDRQRMADVFFLAIGGARQRLYVTTPYFIPTEPIQAVLRSAAQRGVDVRLMVPRLNDVQLVQLASRSFYQELLDEGVRIFEYEPRTLHAKAMVVDDHLVILGSANVDLRSFRLNFELVCVTESPSLAQGLRALFEKNQLDCHEVRLEELARTGTINLLVESVAHLVSPLL